MEIHKLKSEAVIDFETWRKLRQKEKAGDELQMLMSSLREAQRARQFHFRPKEVSVSYRSCTTPSFDSTLEECEGID